MTQLALDLTPPGEPTRSTLFFRGMPDRSGASRYVHLIRPRDGEVAETLARGAKARGEGVRGAGWERRIGSPEECAVKILAVLADGKPRTWTTIALALTGTTGDVLFESAADAGLWLLVERREVAWTNEAPIYFIDASRLEAA